MNGRVAIFLTDLRGGGAERVMLNLAYGFIARGVEVELVLVNLEGPYLAQLPPELRVVHLGGEKLLKSLPRLVKYLRREQPEILLTALEDTNIIALWAKVIARTRTRVVVTVHNNLSKESQNATDLKRRLVPRLIPWFYPWADTVVAVSKGVADDLNTLGLKQHIEVIYNPIVTPELINKAKEPVTHQWLNSGAAPVILGVGRLCKQKDFPTLIRSFALVRSHQLARLIILGEGEDLPDLRALVQKFKLTEDVDFPGFVANPYAYMARSSICVLSSAWEGFGNVLVETMATGVPVVSTACESGPAEVLADGKYGQLVSVGDSENMAQAIIDTLESPPNLEMLKQRASEFSLDRAVSAYLQVFGYT